MAEILKNLTSLKSYASPSKITMVNFKTTFSEHLESYEPVGALGLRHSLGQHRERLSNSDKLPKVGYLEKKSSDRYVVVDDETHDELQRYGDDTDYQ